MSFRKIGLHWLCGLFDGEASFIYRISKLPTKRNLAFQASIQIEMRSGEWANEVTRILEGYDMKIFRRERKNPNQYLTEMTTLMILRKEEIEKLSRLLRKHCVVKREHARLFSFLPDDKKSIKWLNGKPIPDWKVIENRISFLEKIRELNKKSRSGFRTFIWTPDKIRLYYKNLYPNT